MRPLRAGDLGFEIGVPPEMIGVDHDTRTLAELLADIDRLGEQRDAAAVRRIHRVQRLDRERHAAGARMRQDRRHAVEIAPARRLDVARAGRHAAADHHEAVGADRGALVDHALVVVDQRLLSGRVRAAEQPAAAIAGHLHAVRPDDARRLLRPHRLHVLAPRRDAADAVLHQRLDAGLQVELMPDGGEIDREAFGFHGIACMMPRM